MIVALRLMNSSELWPAPVAARGRGAVRAGLRYVRRTPALFIPLGMMAVVGTLGFNFQVILPLLARFSFDGGASTYMILAVAMGVGSVTGALAAGARGRVGPRLLVAAACAFGTAALLAATAPTLPLEVVALALLGTASVTFAAGINSSLQLAAEPAMRGRVMALYSMVFLGSTPIGGPLTGWLSQTIDPRAGLVLGGIAGLAAAAGARSAFARQRRAAAPARHDRLEAPRHRRRREAAEGDGRRASDRVPGRASARA
jgi:MFS family permease